MGTSDYLFYTLPMYFVVLPGLKQFAHSSVSARKTMPIKEKIGSAWLGISVESVCSVFQNPKVFQKSSKSLPKVFQKSSKSLQRKIQKSSKKNPKVFKEKSKSLQRKIQKSSKKNPKVFKKKTKKLKKKKKKKKKK